MAKVPSIVFIDDDQATRESLDAYLRSAGMIVRTCSSATDFLQSSSFDGIDCLVSDLQMPNRDGLALARDLIEKGCQFPIIILTAFATEQARKYAESLGVYALLDKPLDGELILRTIHAALSDRSASKPMENE